MPNSADPSKPSAPSGRVRRRRLSMGLATVLGLARRGFFIPYRYADDVPGPAERPGYLALEARFRESEPTFLETLGLIDSCAADLAAIGGDAPPAPRWKQSWFPGLDAACAYAWVRRKAPGRLVEVGCGHSTRFYARAVADGTLATRITAIDPAPRADIATLPIDIVRATVRGAGPGPYGDLSAGDVLSIDSSHILMPGTDVDFLLGTVLPGLPAGVAVHIHDIFLPDDYPPEWEWRGYNEQLGVAALLQGGGFDLMWSSRYVRTRMTEAVAASSAAAALFVPADAFEASIWLVKRPVG